MNAIGNKEKAILHMAAARLKLPRSTYEDILRIHGGVKSSTALTRPGYQKVLDHLKTLGFTLTPSEPEYFRPSSVSWSEEWDLIRMAIFRLGVRPGFATPRQIWMVCKLWIEKSKSKSESSLNAFLKRIVGRDHWRFLTPVDVSRMVKAINNLRPAKMCSGCWAGYGKIPE